jgi:inosine-uridine nucleoside N-ribohydrolase
MGSTCQIKPIIIDTDAGFDDFIAMSSLSESKFSNIQFISTVGGIQDSPSRAATFFQKAFPQAIINTGHNLPHSDKPTPEWLIKYRKTLNTFIDNYENESSASSSKSNDDEKGESNKCLDEFLQKQDNSSIDLMCIGPLTNIANWISSESTGPLIQKKVRSVLIMGGNIPQSNDEGSEITIDPEFNFAQDPRAANIVLSSQLIVDKIFVLPAQTCINVPPDNHEWTQILELSKSRTGLISKVLQVDDSYGNIKYDPSAAFAYSHPESITCERMKVEVDASTGLVSSSENGHEVEFVTYVDHYSKDGFLSWMRSVVQIEPIED